VGGSGARIRSLDGLRALSVALVVLGHLGGTHGFPVVSPASVLSFGAMLGVRVFFVISGYLITRGLLVDVEGHGRIRLGSFYFRRIFRILVPYYAFLTVMAAAAHFGFIELAPGDLGYSFAYLSDHHLHGEWTHGRWTLGHTWSLAAEEQFYLLWPLLLTLLGVRKGLWIAAAALVAAPAVRLVIWYLQPDESFAIGKTFATVVDSIASGCLLAGLQRILGKSARYRRLLESRWFFVIPAAVLATALVAGRPRIAFVLGAAVVNVGIALCVDRCIRLPDAAISRLLGAAPLVAIGRASYSIYLWQQPLLNRYASGLPSAFPANLITMVGVSSAAWFLIERPSFVARAALYRFARSRSQQPDRSAARQQASSMTSLTITTPFSRSS
jgi:peptidoglycan/LPS O-acetylase OafA/YrhL